MTGVHLPPSKYVCGSCGAAIADPEGTLRAGDLTVCARTRKDAEIKEVAGA